MKRQADLEAAGERVLAVLGQAHREPERAPCGGVQVARLLVRAEGALQDRDRLVVRPDELDRRAEAVELGGAEAVVPGA